jgi:hypothetical protein
MNEQPKHCPICTQDLPAGDFGFCRARRDGRNLYCKPCIREKVRASRRSFKEYKSIRKQSLQSRIEAQLETPIRIVDREYPIDKVRDAIKSGHDTLRLIVAKTKLPTDQVTDLIADLLLWKKEIKSEMVGETRVYFFVEEKPEALPIPNRKSVVLAPFHAVPEFMPGRKRAVG